MIMIHQEHVIPSIGEKIHRYVQRHISLYLSVNTVSVGTCSFEQKCKISDLIKVDSAIFSILK